MENNFSIEFSFSQDEVEKFARLTGDTNPIHLDQEYAAKTFFKKRILHGFLGASVFSRIFGTLYPGEGTVYLKQELKFLAPMFVDTQYKAIVELIEVIAEKKRARLKTHITDKDNNVIISGEALVQNQIYSE